jgi:dTDP-4-amino-4,6-dideoxygalactose transaminase
MKVPLLDLKAQYATIKDEVLASVSEVLETQVCIGGPKVAELEERIAELSGCKYAVGASSGTDALLNVMMSLNLGPGDEVITSTFTFFATAGSIARTGATPVFVDIDPQTYNIDPSAIDAAITSKTKAIVPVHLFGQMAEMVPIMEIARRHGLVVIEDAAQAISATYRGCPAGSLGTAGCLSFFPSKNLGGAGDGGMIVTNDEALYRRLQLMRNHGAKPKYFHKQVGGNFRLDPLQAAILLVKLPHLRGWSEARRNNARYYNEVFAGSGIQTPYLAPDCDSIYNQYVIRLPGRDRLLAHLKERNIGTEIYYPVPLHLQECFQYLGYRQGRLPNAEAAAKEVLALPVYAELTAGQRREVSQAVLDFAACAAT